jgi:gliding motility-associated-like protein
MDQTVSLAGRQAGMTLTSFIANYDYSNNLVKCPCIDSTVINLGNDTTLCENSLLLLNPNLSNATYSWQNNTTNSTFTVAQQGFYWVEATTANGCYVSDSINVNYNPLPVVNLGNDTTICEGQDLVLNASNVNSSFVWQDNSNNTSYTITQPGNYWLTVTENGCSDSDTIAINYAPLPFIYLGNDTSLCFGSNLQLNATIANASYNWQNNTTESTFTVNQQGNYWVVVNANGCYTSDSIDVTYNELPTINLGENRILCKGESILLDAQNTNATFLWQDNSTNATFNVTEQGLYWVSVIENNCINTDSILVDIISCDDNLEMPNVFTPNNDNANDYFFPKNATVIKTANLLIFNRWGKLLFQTTDIEKGWDGKTNGSESPVGTYFWTLSYTTIKNENKTLNGFLNLIR